MDERLNTPSFAASLLPVRAENVSMRVSSRMVAGCRMECGMDAQSTKREGEKER